ncbi:MAG: NAD(+) synthase [Clostridia bacterium]|nr:NAD(+) synthase [Clostridia bacterium]
MRNYSVETTHRVEFVKTCVAEAGVNGIIVANSGGKDCTLAGILCKMACDNTVAIALPCGSARNYGQDIDHAALWAKKFHVEHRVADLTPARNALLSVLPDLTDAAVQNIAPRLRMAAVYAIAAAENRLVCGTGNRSERYLGYFTKWGDGAFDFNPIADLCATEVLEFLKYLGSPQEITDKPPSAGLFEGQTDEADLGVTYAAVDQYLLTGKAAPEDRAIIENRHAQSRHKRVPPPVYCASNNAPE